MNWVRSSFLVFILACFLLLPSAVFAAPPTGETPFEPCLQDNLEPGSAPIKEMGAFQTSLFTGSAAYSYPIDVPPGTNGLAPSIVLSYNSHSAKDRTSWVGAGWSLTLNYIKRDVNSTPEDLSDDIFNLVLNGQQYELVYNETEGRYHTEEESYLFIENKTGSTDNKKGDYWMVRSKDGTTYRFGYTNDSEAVCANRVYVWQWSLDDIEDTQDNHIYYSYNESPTPNDIGAVYLAKIEYNNDRNRGIEFTLEDTDRPDAITIYDQGCKVRYARRLKEIQVHADTEPVATYVLSYDVNDDSTLSLLTQIQKIGSDGVTALPPTTFEYEEIGVGWVRDDSWTAPTYLGGAHGFVVADVNGDGLTDILRGYMYYENYHEYFENAAYINTGNGWSRDDSWAPPVPFVYDKRDDGRFWDRFQVSDINRDGLPDLFRGNDNVYINNGSGWEPDGSWANPFTYQSKSGYRTADVNGDGLPDVLKGYMYYENHHEYFVNASWINTGSGWIRDDSWAPPVPFVYDKRDDGRFWDRYQIADINGDGLPDLFKSDIAGAYINTGSGWEFDNSWSVLPAFQGKDGYRIADVNGDGLPDVVKAEMEYEDYTETFYSSAYINNGHDWIRNDSWAPPFPFIYNHEDGRSWVRALPMDADGDGLVDIIHKYNAYVHAGESYPYRLKRVENGLGGNITIDYAPTTTFPNTSIGFAMMCVKNITSDNSMSGPHHIVSMQRYNCTGGLFNYTEQEFRGFSHVTVTDSLNNIHEHWFHQDDALKGKEYKNEIKDDSGNPYHKTENNWSYLESDGVYVTHLDEKLDYMYDGQVNIPKITRASYEYDGYGNVIRTATLGDVDTTGDDKFVYNEYVYNTTAWIMNLINHNYLLASDDATKLKENRYYYDGHTNLGDPPTRGDLTKEVAWLDSGDDQITSYEYDSYGNMIAKTDPNGNTVNYVYGVIDSTHTFPEQVINALGHTTCYLYDLGTGNLLHVTDSNGFTTVYEYDVFGRRVKEIKPYDSTDLPSITYNYDLDGVAPECSHISLREKGGQTDTIDTHIFVDGFGQQIQTRYEAENSSNEIVTSTFYDELGRVKRESLPYYDTYSASYTSPPLTVKGTSYVYDPIGRTTLIENPDGTTRSIEYDHWIKTSTDENGNQIIFYTDAYNRIVKVEEKNEGEIYTTIYDYNARDELINITDHQGNEFSYEYDTLGRKIAQYDPDMGNWTYTYDPNGNLISQTDARDITISFLYDELDRIVKRDYPNDPGIDYVYDLETNGTLSEVSDSLGTTHYYYDNRLRTLEEERIMDGITWITHWTYDSADRITSITYPTGEIVVYNYNNRGLLDNVSTIVENIDYNELDKVIRKDFANSVSTDLEYNETTQRLSRIYTSGLQNFSYQYDNVGNVVSIEEDIEGKIQNFCYDDLNRLIRAEEHGGYGERSYNYDPIGNLIGLDAPDLNLTFTYGEGTAGPHALTTRLYVPFEKPDLEIMEKWVNWPYNCTICYNVTNIGNGTAPSGHNTTLYIDHVEVAHDHVDVALEPNESYIGCFDDYNWTYTPPSDNVTVCADNDNTIAESNETNNCLTNIWKCGDVTGDNNVRMSDGIRIFHNVTHGVPIDNLWAGDVTGDNNVRMSDGIRIFHNVTHGVLLNCCCE
jgi:YD repeat-containing protein